MRKWGLDNGHEDWRPQGNKYIENVLVKRCFYGVIAKNHEVRKSDENMLRTFIEWVIEGAHVITKNKREKTKLTRQKTARKKWVRELLGLSLAPGLHSAIFPPGISLDWQR